MQEDPDAGHRSQPKAFLFARCFARRSRRLAALVFAAPGEAFAACGGGTTGSTGAKPPSAGTGGTHSGSTPSAGSTGASSCGVNATTSALSRVGLTAPSLSGVHTGVITDNGGKRGGSTTSSKTASTVTNTRTASTNTTNVAGGTIHSAGGPRGGHFFHAGKHP
jgi:hypothetical protein